MLIFLETELSSSIIKTFPIFSYISGKINPKKILIFWEMEILSLPRENFYTSGNESPEEISYLFSKESFFTFKETEIPKKVVLLQEAELSDEEMKTLKNLLYFRK